jgi:hypothetical protein
MASILLIILRKGFSYTLTSRKGGVMGSLVQETNGERVQYLAEAVILQSLADLCDRRYCQDCRRFFRGEGFTVWADLAGLSQLEQIRLLSMIQKTIQNHEYDHKYTFS